MLLGCPGLVDSFQQAFFALLVHSRSARAFSRAKAAPGRLFSFKTRPGARPGRSGRAPGSILENQETGFSSFLASRARASRKCWNVYKIPSNGRFNVLSVSVLPFCRSVSPFCRSRFVVLANSVLIPFTVLTAESSIKSIPFCRFHFDRFDVHFFLPI